jgi:hypothetical protein
MGGTWYPDNYFAYMRSPQWAAVVRRYFKKHRRRCAACPSETHIQLHHRTYVRLEAEYDSDLVALCDTCHSMVHGIHQMAGAELDEVTDLWVSTGQRRGDLATRRRSVLFTARDSHADQAARIRIENAVHVGSFSYVSKEDGSFVVWSTFDRKPKAVWRGADISQSLLVSESIDRRAQERLEEAAVPPRKRSTELTQDEKRKLLSPPIPDAPEPVRPRPPQRPSIRQQLAGHFGRERNRSTETFGYLKDIPPQTNYDDDT